MVVLLYFSADANSDKVGQVTSDSRLTTGKRDEFLELAGGVIIDRNLSIPWPYTFQIN